MSNFHTADRSEYGAARKIICYRTTGFARKQLEEEFENWLPSDNVRASQRLAAARSIWIAARERKGDKK